MTSIVCFPAATDEQLSCFIQEHDAGVLDDAIRNNIVLCSPLTLFAVLAVIRQAADNFVLEQRSSEILRLLGGFSRQWGSFVDQMDKLGRRIDGAQHDFESLAGTRRRQLERQLDRIEDLRASGGIPVEEVEDVMPSSPELDTGHPPDESAPALTRDTTPYGKCVRDDYQVTTVDDDAVRQVELADEALRASEVDAAAAHLSAAIRGFTAAGDRRRAALACAELGSLFALAMGNLTAARAWFLRATRLVEDEPPCIEQGWVAVAALGCDVDDPAVLLARAELALDRARQFGDVNLETKALADAGLAHVQAGRMTEGMALLDEAMALVCGPADDATAAGKSVCSFLTACYYAADFDRAGSWADALRRHGLIGKAPGALPILSSHCDAVHAAALCELGRWGDAEAMLTRVIDDFEARMHMPSWHPAIALAELRIRQGRLADAEMLLLGKDGHLQALLPAARLQLARGDYELARATATRGLRAVGDDRLRAAELLAVLVDTELGAGAIDAATTACDDLVARADRLDVPGLQARIAAVRARVLAATGDTPAAIGTMEIALDRLPATGVPLLRATLLIELVRLHDRMGNRAAAKVDSHRAAAALSGLDVMLPAGDVALLERFGVAGPTTATRTARHTAILSREDRCWVAACDDTRARLNDTKGLRYLAELLASPGVEKHALDLVDRVDGVATGDVGVDRRHLGDAGELLDARARTAYRHRIEALRAEIDDALETGAEEQAEVLQAELDQLVGQLAQAFGLGGRSRRASSAAERARLNVTRALRAATAKLNEALPEAGTVLDRRLRTGLYCAYEPDDGDHVRWVVQS